MPRSRGAGFALGGVTRTPSGSCVRGRSSLEGWKNAAEPSAAPGMLLAVIRADVQFHFQPLSADSPGKGLHPFSAFTASVCTARTAPYCLSLALPLLARSRYPSGMCESRCQAAPTCAHAHAVFSQVCQLRPTSRGRIVLRCTTHSCIVLPKRSPKHMSSHT